MRKPTLEEVAIEAGVSKMTASRALRGVADVSSETRDRVIEAATRMNYVGNRLALSLSTQRTNLVAVVVPSMSNIVFPEVLAGISAGLDGSGMQAVFGISDYDIAKEREIIRDMLSWQPCAIIVTGLDQPEETVDLLRHANIPVIQLMDLDGTPIDFNVGLSHGAAGEDMAEALIASLDQYLATGLPTAGQCFAGTLDWIVGHQVDWSHGEWHARIDESQRPLGDKAGAHWKGPYHTGRALLTCLERLALRPLS